MRITANIVRGREERRGSVMGLMAVLLPVLALEAAFLKTLAKKRAAQMRVVPGIEETKAKWTQKTARILQETSRYQDAEEGTIEWA